LFILYFKLFYILHPVTLIIHNMYPASGFWSWLLPKNLFSLIPSLYSHHL